MRTARLNNAAGSQGTFLPPHDRDVEYTPGYLAKAIISELRPSGRILDPCSGDGAFLEHLPIDSEWCEIRRGRDFFENFNEYDWVIGNPPYSTFRPFLAHAFSIAKNVAFLLPFNEPFQSDALAKMAFGYGGMKTILAHGSGSSVGLPFGFACGTFHWERGHGGACEIRWVRPIR